jgi:hypothetical protein
LRLNQPGGLMESEGGGGLQRGWRKREGAFSGSGGRGRRAPAGWGRRGGGVLTGLEEEAREGGVFSGTGGGAGGS